MTIYEAMTAESQKIRFSDSAGKTAAGYIYAYPPDIPIVVPGEVITENVIHAIFAMKEQGITIIGIEEDMFECIK